jgi:hypothetical protein
MEDTHEALLSGAIKEIHICDEEVMLLHQYRTITNRISKP